MPAWETYAKTLLPQGHGHALWNADPGKEPTVELADVGYLEKGTFIRLFNASKAVGDPSNSRFEVPDGYEPLHVGAIREGTLSSNLPITSETVMQRKVQIDVSGGPMIQGGGGFSFECTKEEGAVLILGEDAERSDALEKIAFVRYVMKNHSSWLKFANDRHQRGIRLNDLVFVTGCDKTSTWACASFSGRSNNISLEFRIGTVGAGQGGVSVWGSWDSCNSVQVQSGPPVTSMEQPVNPLATANEAIKAISESFREDMMNNMPVVERQAAPHVTEMSRHRGTQGSIPKPKNTKADPPEPEIQLSAQSDDTRLGDSMSVKPVTTTVNTERSRSLPRNQCVFLRGFRMCDRSGIQRLLRKKHTTEDGFTHIRRKRRDDRDDPGAGSRKAPDKHRNSNSSLGSMTADKVGSNAPGSSSGSHYGTQRSSFGSSITLSETSSIDAEQLDHEAEHNPSSLRLNESKDITHWDILMEYIFENSQAQLALVHDDDLAALTQNIDSWCDFRAWVRKVAPAIFVQEGVAMLEKTYKASFLQDQRPAKQVIHGSDKLTTPNEPDVSRYTSSEHSITIPIGKATVSTADIHRQEAGVELSQRFSGSQPNHAPTHTSPGPYPGDKRIFRRDCDDISSELTTSYDLTAHLINEFNVRKKVHFANLLREKWECFEPGHTICVPIEDGQHFQLFPPNIEDWVQALCSGVATTAEPPAKMLESINHGAVFNKHNGETKVKAVSIAPSRRHKVHQSPVGASSHSSGTTSTASTAFAWSNYTAATSVPSSVPGPGYLSGRVLKRVGKWSLGVVQDGVITKKANGHIDRLKKWGRRARPELGAKEREATFEMLEDALEMSRPFYSRTINEKAYNIGREVQHWLHSYPDIPKTPEMSLFLIHVQICLIPLILARISRSDPLANDLAYETLDILTRIPLALQAESSDTATAVICLVARELAYSKCTYQHSWLGVDLLRIVEMSLRARSLTKKELSAIKELGLRRMEQPCTDTSDACRSWEVALFAQCASQNAWFKDVVQGPYGVATLLSALDRMLDPRVNVYEVHWDNVALTLRALAFLSEHAWVAERVQPGVVASLLGVFRRSIPGKWLCTRYWAMDALRNLVSHRPPLVRTLMEENALAAFATISAPSVAGSSSESRSEDTRRESHSGSIRIPSSQGRGHSQPSSSSSSGPLSSLPLASSSGSLFPRSQTRRTSEVRDATALRLMEDYKREASKRAEELSLHVRRWHEGTPDSLQRLEVVSTWRWDGVLYR